MHPYIWRILAEQHTRDLQNEVTRAHRARQARQAQRTIEDTQGGRQVLEAAMRVRAHRRNLVARSPSVSPADRYGATGLTRLARTRQTRRFIRTGALLMVIGLRRLARAVRPRWRTLLAGGVLTVVGLMLRSGAWGVVILPGIWFLGSALLVPANHDADPKRSELELELERELAAYARSARLGSWISSAFDARP
jgi:hypothetical protein